MDRGYILKAMIMAFCGFSLWTVGDSCIRYLQNYPPVQIGFIASIYSVVLLLAFSPMLGGIGETFRKPKLGWQLGRGVVLAISGILSFYTFANLELPTAYAIVFVTPFLSKILSVWLTGEKVRPACWVTSAIAFAGVLVVIRPGMVPLELGVLAALGLGVFFALGYVLGRVIGEENQTLLSLSLFPDLWMIVLLAGPAMAVLKPMEGGHFLLAVLIGSLSAIGTTLVSLAYARAPAGYVAPVHYVQIVWGTIWGALFFAEYPDLYTIGGAALIIAAGVVLVRSGSSR